jgi:two-component system sensor histidine kinase CiaH
MFKKARIKLAGWYLLIIMVISLSFSVAIYTSVDRELSRIDNLQRVRQERVDTISGFLIQNNLPVPPEVQPLDSETVEQARIRILSILGVINLSILVISGLGGYLLAGLTLDPISKMMEDQKEFVGNASHELRTPLTSLKTEIEVALRDKKITISDAKKLLKSNLEDVNHMQRLSNYLLELNKYENADLKLETTNVDLSQATNEAIEKVRPLAIGRRIKINTSLPKVEVKGNESALVELATILIDNAIKYSGKSKRIVVRTKKGGIFEVEDFGVGIAEVDLPHIFDRFYRVETSRSKEKVDGYGLGLSIAKSIVDKMSGKIKVTSEIGKGSTFSVQLPLS